MTQLALADIPRKVQQEICNNHLGNLIAVYPSVRGWLVARIFSTLLCLGGFALHFVKWVVVNGTFPPFQVWLLTTGGVVCGAWLLASLIRQLTLKVYLFQRGMIIAEMGRCLIFPWQSIRITQRSIKVHTTLRTSYHRWYRIENIHDKNTYSLSDVRHLDELSGKLHAEIGKWKNWQE